MGVIERTSVCQWRRTLEECVEESLKFGRARPVWLENASTNTKAQV